MITAADHEPNEAYFPPFSNPLIAPTTGREFQEQVAWARAALECGEIADLVTSVRRPLTLGRVVDNFGDSFTRSDLVIPPDPEEAYREFCGDDTPKSVRDVRSRS